MKKINELLKKYEELILYVVFGGLTTVVNFAVYWVLNKALGENFYLVNNVIAWFVSVVFAYVTNKLWVFESKSWAPKILAKEVPEFFAARVFSLLVEEGGLWLFVEKMGFEKFSFDLFGFEFTGKLIAKLVLAVIVVILNYFFSKFVIFAKKKKDKK
ncbi:MAG: GtrA family protein [Eubacterium sp.]